MFLIKAFFPQQYQNIVSALKIIAYNGLNIVCFCLQTSGMYLKLNVI